MKDLLRVLFVFIASSNFLFSQEIPTPHLLLYFDINKTLIASDKAGNKSTENILNELLAEKYVAKWDPSLTEPISFATYIHERIVPGSQNDRQHREKAHRYLHHFMDYLKEYNHPLYPSVLQEYKTLLTALDSMQGRVFASFYRLLAYLDQQEISYSIILRSFGEEVLEVKEEIAQTYPLIFSHAGTFQQGKLIFEGEENAVEAEAIYLKLRNVKHAAIQDDWNYWNEHGMALGYGKPFYIDRTDQEILSIFFDDNVCLDASNQIISPLDATTGEVLLLEELIDYRQIVAVDTIQAIFDVDYYKNKVEEAIFKRIKIFSPFM